MLKQKTLKDSFSLSGKGLHTGLVLHLILLRTITDIKSNALTWKDNQLSMQ